jgi:drug/metabolite transporter (DMT)-like permease
MTIDDDEHSLLIPQDGVLPVEATGTHVSPFQIKLGYCFVGIAQLGFSFTQVFAKLRQSGEHRVPFAQVVLTRMFFTMALSILSFPILRYHYPLTAGHYFLVPRALRKWMVAHAFLTFVAISANTFAVGFLPVSEATVLLFLLPLNIMILSNIFLHEHATIFHFAASFIAFCGIVLLARPTELFQGTPDLARITAIIVAVSGSLCTALSFMTFRKVGTRVHTVTGVFYLSTFAFVVSALLLAAQPNQIVIPSTPREVYYIVGIGLVGVFSQFTLTAGLQRAPLKSTNLMYVQIVMAPLWDYFIFSNIDQSDFMDIWGISGILLILSGACYVTLTPASVLKPA